ncbi:MAG: HlyD family efflux transporter periplasmic adaptor subunit [Oscillospiraceae bacterium]|nr:HlyD family efflux transporter periplasmic adaptor subunit [Oscillospiraceae bacterium]
MRGSKFLRIALVLLAVFFVFHQMYSSLFKPITTQSAEYFEYSDGLEITGYIIRNEETVSTAARGVLHFVAEDGARVAKNGLIAQIYDNDNASILVSQINNIKSQISDIEELQAYNDQKAPDLDLINNRVKLSLNDLINGTSHGNFNDVQNLEKEFLLSINRRQMITGEQTDFSEQLNALKSKLNELNSSLSNPTGSINSKNSGYFISTVDGYENLLTADNLNKITPEYIKNLNPEVISGDSIGKIVSDYEWYIAARMPINDSLKFKVDDTATISTTLKSSPELTVTVSQINLSEAKDYAVVIFSCNQMNSELAAMRFDRMTVVNHTYKGLKLSKKSLRVVDSKTGVYVLSGITLHFVPVNVIFSDDDFIICEQQKSTETVLRLYDEVVVKGRNLYDGKVVG